MDELLDFTGTSQEIEEEHLTSAEVLQKLEEVIHCVYYSAFCRFVVIVDT